MATTDAARTKAIEDRFEEPFPESWVPKTAGEQIVGTFVRLDKGTTEFGTSWIVVLDTGKGVLRSIWLYHSALKNAFARVRPEAGELVGVRYEGQKPVKNPTPGKKSSYHDYKVVVDREKSEAPPQWDLIGADFAPDVDPFPVHDEPSVGGGQSDDIPFQRTFA